MFFRGSDQTDAQVQRTIGEASDTRTSLGKKDAPVEMIEFIDILCPYCAKVDREVMPRITSDYIDTGKVHYVARVVGMLTPDSRRAAVGAYCAAEQGKFWEYVDTAYDRTWKEFYSRGKSPQEVTLFSDANIRRFAEGLSVDMLMWGDCLQNGRYYDTVDKNQKQMNDIGAYGTPHFLFNGQNYSGAPPYELFKVAIDGELRKKESGN